LEGASREKVADCASNMNCLQLNGGKAVYEIRLRRVPKEALYGFTSVQAKGKFQRNLCSAKEESARKFGSFRGTPSLVSGVQNPRRSQKRAGTGHPQGFGSLLAYLIRPK
jgi:hypothetical protein